MRPLFLPAIIAVLLLADQPARAQPARAGCMERFLIQVNGITQRQAHVRAGGVCRINIYSLAGWRLGVHSAEIVELPTQGTLRTADKTAGRGVITYVPRPGFVGRDRFAVMIRYQTFTSAVFTRLEVDVTVTP
jgi:hypothetical protein